MTPDNPFLQALLAEPDDDTVRLAMADWLDENDQPARAEFIRVQIELARRVEERERLRHLEPGQRDLLVVLAEFEDRKRRQHLELRQRDLLVAHDVEWVAPLARVLKCKPSQWGGWVFRRGFVEYFNLPAFIVNKHGTELAELTPIRELFLRPCNAENVVALCRKQWLASVTHLYMEGASLTPPAMLAMLESPYLANLRVLRYKTHTPTGDVTLQFQRRFAAVRNADGETRPPAPY
jgi:uncharacterized protein (TIGR02996 family)